MHSDYSEKMIPTVRNKILELMKESVNDCYQCGKCAAGCPLNDEMDIAPNQILRLLQLNKPEYDIKVLKSYSIWLCLTCDMCHSRCPQDVNMPEIMDYLRTESYRRGLVNKKAKEIIDFHKSFLDSVEQTGRLYEVGLIAGYKMRTMNLLQDLTSAPGLFFKGKLKLIPNMVHNRKAIKRIFRKSEEIQRGDN
jgi:heterodisulfide reductase subunit C